MKIDELRRELDDLAGDAPVVDDAYAVVTVRARRQQLRARVGIVAACALVIAVAIVGTVQLRWNDRHLSVVSPLPPSGRVADLAWTRVAAPMTINRIVTANGHTFAVGSSPDGRAAIAELGANGESASVDPTANYDQPIRPGAVNDLVGLPGALVAVGESVGASGSRFSDAWRSTDGGHEWHSVRVEVPPTAGPVTLSRVVVSNGVVYAIGSQADTTTGLDLHCPILVWKSTDGTDFHLTPAQFMCAGTLDATDGPAGVLITTSDNATAWTERKGDEWSPRSISDDAPHVFSVAGSEDGYVAVGSVGTPPHDLRGAIWWSADGMTWSRVATNAPPADPTYQQAQFTGVAHTEAGWIAVGWQVHPGADRAVSDEVLWTSPDGQRWTPNTRDGGIFEQYAWAESVGATTDGFAIVGKANITGTGIPGDPTRQDFVLWLGSSAPSSSSGIIEGSMRMVGGPPGATDQYVPGAMIATAADGREVRVAVRSGGRFSTNLRPGTYRVVGHSPLFGHGTYDCTIVGRARVEANAVTHIALICPRR